MSIGTFVILCLILVIGLMVTYKIVGLKKKPEKIVGLKKKPEKRVRTRLVLPETPEQKRITYEFIKSYTELKNKSIAEQNEASEIFNSTCGACGNTVKGTIISKHKPSLGWYLLCKKCGNTWLPKPILKMRSFVNPGDAYWISLDKILQDLAYPKRDSQKSLIDIDNPFKGLPIYVLEYIFSLNDGYADGYLKYFDKAYLISEFSPLNMDLVEDTYEIQEKEEEEEEEEN